MTDHESGPLPELTPEQESTVRRLLAEARHDEPLPVEVGDRLDRVLADLSRDPLDRSAPVIDLAARRRRRNAAGLLVAAAAVIVGGFGVGQVIDVGGSADSDSADGGGSTVARDDSADDRGAAPGESSEGEAGDAPAQAAKALPLQLTSQHLERDVRRQLRRQSYASLDGTDPSAMAEAEFPCASAPYGLGELLPAYYDGIPTVLALRPPEGQEQRAEVLECGTAVPLRSFTIQRR